VLRIHLTAEDLLRIKFAAQPAPLIEVSTALAMLQRQDPGFAAWRRWAAAHLPAKARPLLELVPPTATGPLFLDPSSPSLPEALELVQRAPPEFVTAELDRVFAARPPTSFARRLAGRDREAWSDLRNALRLTHARLLENAWPQICAGFRAEVVWRGQVITDHGVRAAMSALHPLVSWDGPVMQIGIATEWDAWPRGCGLTLLPSLLWAGRPLVSWHIDGSVLIIYPALTPLPLIGEVTGDPLARLLGGTRAALLRLALQERTTSQLARELGVSAATVSSHTKTLRSAGLIVTVRAGKAVLHSVTPLGDRLLESAGRTGP
jgi:DNA-binding transcriptional ArsR family regulator